MASQLRDGTLEEMSALTYRWSRAILVDVDEARTAIERHAEVYSKLGPVVFDPWRSASHLLQACHAIFLDRDPEPAEGWMDGIAEPVDSSLRTVWKINHAALAAMRSRPNASVLLDEAETQLANWIETTGQCGDTEKFWIEMIRSGALNQRPIRSSESS